MGNYDGKGGKAGSWGGLCLTNRAKDPPDIGRILLSGEKEIDFGQDKQLSKLSPGKLPVARELRFNGDVGFKGGI
jgi:hypothetical protein